MKKIICLLLSLMFMLSLSACGNKPDDGKDKNADETKVVDVMFRLDGYGDGWIKENAEKFNELYKNEGYKINVLKPRAGFQGTTALSELRSGYNETGYDIVFTAGVSIEKALDPEYGACVEEITDVMNGKAINFDGSESDKTLNEMFKGIHTWQLKKGDKYYAFPYVGSITGLICNKKVLNKYGIERLPRTTDELFEQFDIIYNGVDGVKGMSPITWGGENAFGYALSPFYVAMAQMMGVENWNKFFALDYLIDENGKVDPEGYNHVNNPDIKSAIKVIMHAFDPVYSVRGALTQRHDVADAQVVTGKAAFMFNGEYFYNEVRTNFGQYLDDMDFACNPIISDLGVKLKLDGTGSDSAKCDRILRKMVDLIDEGKTASEIKSAITEATITDEQVERIIQARKVNRVDVNQAYIVKDSPAKEVAGKFLRFLASKDAASIYAERGMLSAFSKPVVTDSTPEFKKHTAKYMIDSEYFTTSQPITGSLRAKANIFPIPPYNALMPVTFASEMGIQKPSERDYDALAQSAFDKIVSNVQKNWGSIVGNGGFELAK